MFLTNILQVTCMLLKTFGIIKSDGVEENWTGLNLLFIHIEFLNSSWILGWTCKSSFPFLSPEIIFW